MPVWVLSGKLYTSQAAGQLVKCQANNAVSTNAHDSEMHRSKEPKYWNLDYLSEVVTRLNVGGVAFEPLYHIGKCVKDANEILGLMRLVAGDPANRLEQMSIAGAEWEDVIGSPDTPIFLPHANTNDDERKLLVPCATANIVCSLSDDSIRNHSIQLVDSDIMIIKSQMLCAMDVARAFNATKIPESVIGNLRKMLSAVFSQGSPMELQPLPAGFNVEVYVPMGEVLYRGGVDGALMRCTMDWQSFINQFPCTNTIIAQSSSTTNTSSQAIGPAYEMLRLEPFALVTRVAKEHIVKGLEQTLKRAESNHLNVTLRKNNPFASSRDQRARPKSKVLVEADSWEQLITQKACIADKSLFPVELMEDSRQVLSISTPRRWCKTNNLSLCHLVLNAEVDMESGELLPDQWQATEARRLLKEKYPLKIFGDDDFLADQFGQYPVVFMSLELEGFSSFDDFLGTFALHIAHYIDTNWPFLLSSEHVPARLKKELGILVESPYSLPSNKHHLTRSMETLFRAILAHFNGLRKHDSRNKPILLLDEYDGIVNAVIRNPKLGKDESQKIVAYYQNFLRYALTDHNIYSKAVLVGRYPTTTVLDASKSSGVKLGNITPHTHTRNEYAEYFGFNDDDIESLCAAADLPTEVRKKAKAWYGHYAIWNGQELVRVHNPTSFVKFLERYENARKDTAPDIDSILRDSLPSESKDMLAFSWFFRNHSIMPIIESLLLDSQADVYANIVNDLRPEDLTALKEVMNEAKSTALTPKMVDLFLSLLYAEGYIDVKRPGIYGVRKRIHIPNKERWNLMMSKLKDYYEVLTRGYDAEIPAATRELKKLYESASEWPESRSLTTAELEPLNNALTKIVNKMGTAFHLADLNAEQIDAVARDRDEMLHANENIFHTVVTHAFFRDQGLTVVGSDANMEDEPKKSDADCGTGKRMQKTENKAKMDQQGKAKPDGGEGKSVQKTGKKVKREEEKRKPDGLYIAFLLRIGLLLEFKWTSSLSRKPLVAQVNKAMRESSGRLTYFKDRPNLVNGVLIIGISLNTETGENEKSVEIRAFYYKMGEPGADEMLREHNRNPGVKKSEREAGKHQSGYEESPI